jgi:hypothetical protein
MKMLIIVIALLTSCLLSLEASETYPVSPSDQAFFKQVQRAVLADDVEWISRALSSYPFTVKLKTGQIKLQNEGDLKKHAKTIFNTKLKEAVRNQSSDALFKNWQGIMIGDGEIWFSEIGQTNKNATVWVYRIIAINVPQERSNKTPEKSQKEMPSGK